MTATETLPPWTKPLDSVERCVESIDTEAHAFDADQHLTALTFLTQRKHQLSFNLKFRFPSKQELSARMRHLPAWDRIIRLTEDASCCYRHRVIVGGSKTSALAGDDCAVIMRFGQAFDLVPRGLHRRHAPCRIGVTRKGGGTVLSIRHYPYGETTRMPIFVTSQVHELSSFARVLIQQQARPIVIEGWTVCAVRAADTAARTVTIIPNATFDALPVDG